MELHHYDVQIHAKLICNEVLKKYLGNTFD